MSAPEEHAIDCTGCDGPGIVPCAADRVEGDFAMRDGKPIKDLRPDAAPRASYEVDPDPSDDDGLMVGASIFEGATGVARHANIRVPADASDDLIAAQLLASVLAVATACGPGIAHALTEKLAALR